MSDKGQQSTDKLDSAYDADSGRALNNKKVRIISKAILAQDSVDVVGLSANGYTTKATLKRGDRLLLVACTVEQKRAPWAEVQSNSGEIGYIPRTTRVFCENRIVSKWVNIFFLWYCLSIFIAFTNGVVFGYLFAIVVAFAMVFVGLLIGSIHWQIKSRNSKKPW